MSTPERGPASIRASAGPAQGIQRVPEARVEGFKEAVQEALHAQAELPADPHVQI